MLHSKFHQNQPSGSWKEDFLIVTTIYWGLDSAVVNALACHRCDSGLNPGVGMWQGSASPSKVGGYPRVLRFLPQRVYKFFELSV